MRLLHGLVLLSLFFLPLCAVAEGSRGPLLGGWTPIKDIEDPHVTEIAKFAVSEYDKRSGAALKLEKVLKGETQVVAGTNYRLVLAAKDGSSSASKNYEAVVWEKPWEHFMNLTSFKPVRG
ncbi:cysteine proteinase inhibitor 5 [Prosopis cineraria]|uniref:cysteine proteinase inhibitor 5 n=1 Tax=Prosopis cineraria TaxID=364024 RepID=UPI00240EFE26|nr:cysteine proteinase inhibitor 5 [Prosopis cineraria]